MAWAREDCRTEVAQILADMLEGISNMMRDHLHPSGYRVTQRYNILAQLTSEAPLVILASLHATLTRCPLPPLPAAFTLTFISHLLDIAAPENLVKLLNPTSSSSTPGNAPSGESSAIDQLSPSTAILLVSELSNILLASATLPAIEPRQRLFARGPEITDIQSVLFPASIKDDNCQSVFSDQITQMLDLATSRRDAPLTASDEGRAVVQRAEEMSSCWWTEIMGHRNWDGDRQEKSEGTFTFFSEIEHEEEVQLSVAVLVRVTSFYHWQSLTMKHLMNLLALSKVNSEDTHLNRLKLLLSEKSTISDPRLLEAAFQTAAIFVRK